MAGVLIMKFLYKATGTDIIPNKKLWLAFPLLLKVMFNVDNSAFITYYTMQEGCAFTFSPCLGFLRQRLSGKAEKYEEIPP